MADHRSATEKIRRRVPSVAGLFVTLVVVTASIPLWLPVALVIDAVRLRFRFPIARLLAFAVAWSWIEATGVLRAAGLWMTGRAGNAELQYRLMAWWAGALMRALEATTGIEPRVEGLEALDGGDAIVLSRHVSLADSLLSGWVTATRAGLWPRYVLKRELLFDPCLDIVGLRIPNHFLDRSAVDADTELAALSTLANGVGPNVVAVIFAEGTRSNDVKRARALEKIGERDPARADRMSGLQRLLPPRPAGSAALLAGAPDADVVFAWHTGFDGLDSFGGMVRHLAKPLPQVRFVMRRVDRGLVPEPEHFEEWLDEQWLQMDTEVETALRSSS